MQAHLLSLAMQPEPAVPARVSGACALVAYLVGESLTVAGAGDCRAVIASEADGTVCSTDLTLTLPLTLPLHRHRSPLTAHHSPFTLALTLTLILTHPNPNPHSNPHPNPNPNSNSN